MWSLINSKKKIVFIIKVLLLVWKHHNAWNHHRNIYLRIRCPIVTLICINLVWSLNLLFIIFCRSVCSNSNWNWMLEEQIGLLSTVQDFIIIIIYWFTILNCFILPYFDLNQAFVNGVLGIQESIKVAEQSRRDKSYKCFKLYLITYY